MTSATEARSRPERLTALDTSFLRVESSRTPLHIGALLVLDGAPWRDDAGRIRLDDLRAHVGRHLHLVPRLRQLVREVPFDVARPVWCDDEDFDLDHHIRLAHLPSPGDEPALLRLTEQLMMTCLDRSRPLWEWWVIDGLADGRVALVEKVHHAAIDGVSGVQMMAALSDLGDLASPPDGPWEPAACRSAADLLADAALDLAREPWRLMSEAPRLCRHQLRRVGGLLRWPTGESRVLRSAPIGPRRRLAPVVLSLAEVKAIGHAHGTKVNDVVLGIVAGGLRELLVSRGIELDGEELHALVPESVRADHEHLALGNRVGGMFAPLRVDEPDALRRLELIRDVMCEKRAAHEGEASSELLDAADRLPEVAIRLLLHLIDAQPFASTVVTNIPGPREPLSVMGATIESMVPVVPLAARVTLGIAVLSYLDDLTIALWADADAHPDLDVMVEGMQSTYDALRAASVKSRRASRPRPG